MIMYLDHQNNEGVIQQKPKTHNIFIWYRLYKTFKQFECLVVGLFWINSHQHAEIGSSAPNCSKFKAQETCGQHSPICSPFWPQLKIFTYCIHGESRWLCWALSSEVLYLQWIVKIVLNYTSHSWWWIIALKSNISWLWYGIPHFVVALCISVDGTVGYFYDYLVCDGGKKQLLMMDWLS